MIRAASVTSTGVRRGEINFMWLIRLRWTVFAGQAATIALAHWGLDIALPWPLLYAIVALELGSNLIARAWAERRRRQEVTGELAIGAYMALDLFFLTALLFCSGGPSNPFSVFYIINISLAAAVLPSRWAWSLTAMAVACFSFLFECHLPIAELAHIHGANGDNAAAGHADSMRLHLLGMLIAFAGAAGCVAYFVTRTRRELELAEDELAESQRRRAQAERLESLVTLAAGAAHELATPLATVLVVAREIECVLESRESDDGLLADVRVIHREVARCREILDSLTSKAGESVGEAWRPAPLIEVLEEVRDGASAPARVSIEMDNDLRARRLSVPRRALVQSLGALVQNGLDASPGGPPVRLRVEADVEGLLITIEDHGCGMDEATQRRIGEPFFTSRAGRGMGLGVFVARRVFAELQGQLDYDSRPNEGTRARVRLPLRVHSPLGAAPDTVHAAPRREVEAVR